MERLLPVDRIRHFTAEGEIAIIMEMKKMASANGFLSPIFSNAGTIVF
jgi:hypothetical protein